jgi:hypothetical protein
MQSTLAFMAATLWAATSSIAADQTGNADRKLPAPTAEPALPDASEVASSAAVAEEHHPLDDATLGDLRGGQTIIVGNQTLTAITSGNVLNGDYVAGAISLSDNAFANFNGIGNLAINTGAQVSLQSGMSVVINVGP